MNEVVVGSVLVWLDRADQDLFRLVNGGLHAIPSDRVQSFFLLGNIWGNALLAIPVLVAAWVLARRGPVRVFVEVVLALLLVLVVNGALKKAFDRPRPMTTLAAEFASGSVVGIEGERFEQQSMPSGHLATYGALATVLAAWASVVPNARRRRLAYAALVAGGLHGAVGRVYAGAHFPLDTLAGAGLGVLCGAVSLGVTVIVWRVAVPLRAPLPSVPSPSLPSASLPSPQTSSQVPR